MVPTVSSTDTSSARKAQFFMNARPRLSVVTVTRNAKEALLQTWESLRNQAFVDWEWIVVDGASTDGTVLFLEEIHSEKIKFISENDSGIYNAMNKGIGFASGEYLYFLNAGDTLVNAATLKEVMPHLNGSGIFYCDIVMQSPASTTMRFYPDQLGPRFWIGSHLCHQAALFHRNVFENDRYDETKRFAADYEFFARAQKKYGHKFTHVPKLLANYDLSGVSAAQKNRVEVLTDIREISEKYFGLIETLRFGSLEMYSLSGKLKILVLGGFKVINRLRAFLFRTSGLPVDLFTFPNHGISVESPLKILHLSSYQDSGGASVAAMRLHAGLSKAGVNSIFVTLTPDSFRPGATQITLNTGLRKIGFRVRLFGEKILLKLGRIPNLGHVSLNWATPMDVVAFRNLLKSFSPDVVHIHWIGHNFLPLEILSQIKRPLVWTFHDMWPFLSVDHVDSETPSQGSFKEYLTKKRGLINIDRWMYNRKDRIYRTIEGTTAICPSQWMLDRSSKSPLVKGFNKIVVPNMVTTNDFFPIEKGLARDALGIQKDSRVFLFGAFGPFIETNKGFGDFAKVIESYKAKNPSQPIVILTFGSSIGYKTIQGITHKHFDWIKSTEFLRLVYSAADIMVVASVIESFCLVAAEAMACGTPVVCYDTSGLKDVVDHRVNGYRAQPADVDDLYTGVCWALEDSSRFQELRKNGIDKVKSHFDEPVVVAQHTAAYQNALRGSRV